MCVCCCLLSEDQIRISNRDEDKYRMCLEGFQWHAFVPQQPSVDFIVDRWGGSGWKWATCKINVVKWSAMLYVAFRVARLIHCLCRRTRSSVAALMEPCVSSGLSTCTLSPRCPGHTLWALMSRPSLKPGEEGVAQSLPWRGFRTGSNAFYLRSILSQGGQFTLEPFLTIN